MVFKTEWVYRPRGISKLIQGRSRKLHKEPEYMSADYFFIGSGSNNLKDKALSGRMKLLGLKILILTRKARINTCFKGGVHICPCSSLILKLLCFSLKIAEVSLSKWAYLVSR